MKKILVIILFAIIIAAISGYFYLYQEHRNISQEKPKYELTANSFLKEYKNSVDATNIKYLDQAILIVGNVTNKLNDSVLVLNNQIICNFKNKLEGSPIHKQLSIKGRVVGYDDLLEEVKLDGCVIDK